MKPIIVTTTDDGEEAYGEAAELALTQSNGRPLALEGVTPYVAPDKYKGGYLKGYAWTFKLL